MLTLKSAPQDLSYSKTLLVRAVMFYILSGILVLQSTENPDDLIAGLFLGLFIHYVFVYSVLAAMQRLARFVQTFSAIVGVAVIFNLMTWPVIMVLADTSYSDEQRSSATLLFLALLGWEVLVKAHILRHALEMKMLGALALSFSLFFIVIALSQLLLPAPTAN